MDHIEEFFKNKKFLQEGGRACYFYTNYVFCSRAFKKHAMWENYISYVSTSKNHKVTWYMAPESQKDFDYILERVLKDENYLENSEKRANEIVLEMDRKFSGIDLHNIPDTQLSLYYSDYFDTYCDLGTLPLILREIDRSVLEKLKTIFEDRSNIDEIIAIVGYPTKMSYGRQEEIAILEAAKKVRNQHKDLDKLAGYILKEFGTSTLGYFDERAKEIPYYISKILEESEHDPESRLKFILLEEKDHLKLKDDLKRELPMEEQKIIDVAGRVVFTKDHYKFYINKLQQIGEPIFQEIARRNNISPGEVKDFTPDEVRKLLMGENLDLKEIQKRIQNHMVVTTDKSTEVLVGDKALAFEQKFLAVDKSKFEFKGRIACKGKGTGIARVVLSTADFQKMNQGDILVVMNTSPDFVPIMKKAAAIVAEEGGITGHVSVVSREFNIPCVVGISKITEIIEDGNTVEVDAENGVVKILR